MREMQYVIPHSATKTLSYYDLREDRWFDDVTSVPQEHLLRMPASAAAAVCRLLELPNPHQPGNPT